MALITGFIIGFLIPLFGLRFPKFMPCDAGTALAYMFHIPRFPRYDTKLLKAWAKLIGHCSISGIIFSLLFYYADIKLSYDYSTSAIISFVFILGLLSYIDYKTMYLPDVLTIPFIILGFFFSPDYEMSALGAVFGFFMPTIASALVCRFKPDSFGGGDVKILAGIGAWLGFMGVAVAIVLSVIIFIFISLIKKEKAGPYGPSIAIASYLVLTNISAVPIIVSFFSL